jgi:hypothetical protein
VQKCENSEFLILISYFFEKEAKVGSGAKIHKTEFIRNPNELLKHLSSKIVTNIKDFHKDM